MKKCIKLLIFTAIAASAVIIFLPDKKDSPNTPKSPPAAAASVSDRITYFASHGWEVEEIGSKTIKIPEEFTGVYEEYALLQDKQGLPLREYAGQEAQLYVYDVKNYSPDNKNLLAELLVCSDTAVASMVYSDDGGSFTSPVS